MVLVYEMIGRLFSRAQMRKLGSFLFRVAMVVSTDMTANSSLFFTSIAVVIAIVLAVVAICLSAYVILSMMAGSRKQKVEDVLPDFLSLSASNMRAGMTIDQAMWYAAKPEFGILSVEVATVAKRAFGGVPFNQAIDSLPDKFDSKSLRRAVSLIKQGLASGGKLAEILEQTAEESRQIRILRKDIASSLMMYVIFIVFAGAIGTPFLFAISGQLVAMIEHIFLTLPQTSSTTTSAFGSSFAMPNKTVVSSADFYLFTLLCSAVTAIFSALIIGVISHGSKREGILYIPVLLIISFTIFFLIGTAIEGFLAGIAGG
ncbi:MAG: type II secretion system F family protein [Candidatus Micrarchaeota archaeon]|nr:type II secretion system F family protein [Candidatus Micrarchaeota archaeon]